MNKVTIAEYVKTASLDKQSNDVEIEGHERIVSTEFIRIHTDYFYFSSHQLTPEHKEVTT